MSEAEVSQALIDEIDEIDIDIARADRAERLKMQFDHVGCILTYDLERGDRVMFSIGYPKEFNHPAFRILTAEMSDNLAGTFTILGDSEEIDTLIGRSVNFGSEASSAGNITLRTPGLLRALIQPDSFVAIDKSGNNFFSPESENVFFPVVYTNLNVNGVEVF